MADEIETKPESAVPADPNPEVVTIPITETGEEEPKGNWD